MKIMWETIPKCIRKRLHDQCNKADAAAHGGPLGGPDVTLAGALWVPVERK